MLGFRSDGLADLTDRLVASLFVVLAVLFGIGALVALHFKGALSLVWMG